jgi:hypothetical protein
MRRVLIACTVAVTALASPLPAGASSASLPPKGEAIQLVLEQPKIASWLERYPRSQTTTSAYLTGNPKHWTVSVVAPAAGQIAAGEVDAHGRVSGLLAGPQVAWPLARGGGIAGTLDRAPVWLLFCGFFLLGLANLRRPLSVQNLDLLAALSLSLYLGFFNKGHVFASVIAASSSLVYLAARCTWIGVRNRPTRTSSSLPVWVIVAALVFLLGVRVGLNVEGSNTLDIGYAGVIGAERLTHAEALYGNFPRKTAEPCAPLKANGEAAAYVQANGRCESPNVLGDTYGPVNYHAYLPGLWLLGWSGKWDSLPAVHFTSLLFDLLVMLGLGLIGYRFGGDRLAATLPFAWAAYPFTQYASNTNANDTIMAALLVWGFWAAASPASRGVFAALASWTKLAALVLVPLWTTFPARRPRRSLVFAGAFVVTTALSFWILLAGGDPLHSARLFYERTFEIQADRSSPFSLWDWGDYHAAGLPDLKWLQRVLQACLVVGALAVAIVPRTKSHLQLAAFSAALLMGFELTLTHWTATYVVWFFPFLLLATYAGTALQGCISEIEDTESERANPESSGRPAIGTFEKPMYDATSSGVPHEGELG